MISETVNSGFQPPSRTQQPRPANTGAKPAVTDPAQKNNTQQHETFFGHQQLQQAVTEINDYVQNLRRTLSFSIEEETGRTVIRVYDSETNELIRQIPPEETLKLVESLQSGDATLFVKERA